MKNNDNISLFDILFGSPKDKEKEKKKEEIKKKYNLSDKEALEVMKGNYKPYNFDEEDLEEDDYYSEDDE